MSRKKKLAGPEVRPGGVPVGSACMTPGGSLDPEEWLVPFTSLQEIRSAARALVDALPACHGCGQPTTWRVRHESLREIAVCDACRGQRGYTGDEVETEPHAEPLRKLQVLLGGER